MSDLYFRLGQLEGFTSVKLADKKVGFANLIRELLQNSLDASRELGDDHECEVNIYIETIKKDDIPHIGEYEKALKNAVETQEEKESYNDNSERIVASIEEALKQEKLDILMFSDNGVGMKKERLEGLLDERSMKNDELAGGSFGVGHLSSYSLSSLRYVLYATKFKESGQTKTLFTGSPILAGYDDGKAARGSKGMIVAQKPDNESKPSFDFPAEFPDFVRRKMGDLETGTIVTILGLTKNWDEQAEYAIVSNFFHAISHGSLSIHIHREERGRKTICPDEAERLVKTKKDVKQARDENILSGEAVWQAWQAVNDGGTQKDIQLSNKDKVYVFIKTDKGMKSAIALIRNGMLIARHDSMLSKDINWLRQSDYEPFTAVVDVDKKDAPKLFKLVRGAEGPHHNKLVKGRLNGHEEKILKKLFKELSEKIQEHLCPINRESFVLPLFGVPNKAEAGKQEGRSVHSRGQTGTGKDNPAHPPPKPKPPPFPHPDPPNPPRPAPVITHRNLTSKNAVRHYDEGDKWTVKLRITPSKQEADNVYFSMCLGEDSDKNEGKTYMDFLSVSVDGESVKIPANGTQIPLGKLNQSKQYNIIAEVKKPKEIGSMKIALLPILGLKKG